VSPLTVRRYRAERLLRQEFEALRGRVLATVGARLRGSGVRLDPSDLEACYATAWQGLYKAMLDGEEIENVAGWLVLVTWRRAIEEQRSRGRVQRLREQMRSEAARGGGSDGECERDLAGELDDRARLRHLLEGLRGRLTPREREAAVLCYLQGLTRAQAAAKMGVSETRMRKLMEGSGAGRPGVAGKVGALVETIQAGRWCEEQGSLMRAFAYGVLDPEGERYRLALAHREQCPACRVYVLSLRGLAATLPPVFLPWGLGAAALALDGLRGSAAGTGARVGSGALSASSAGAGAAGAGAAGGGTAGGGWLFVGAGKLAAGCVLALSVGAGCAVLDTGGLHTPAPRHAHHATPAFDASSSLRASAPALADAVSAGPRSTTRGPVTVAANVLAPAARASHEFGLEQRAPAPRASTLDARAASARSGSGSTAQPPTSEAAPASAQEGAGSSSASAQSAAPTSAAEREFSPG
jgi:RNA polymerase sigma factor (sigma-70 family)